MSDATVSSIDAPIAAAGAGGSAGSEWSYASTAWAERDGVRAATVSSIDPNGAAASGGSAVSEWS